MTKLFGLLVLFISMNANAGEYWTCRTVETTVVSVQKPEYCHVCRVIIHGINAQALPIAPNRMGSDIIYSAPQFRVLIDVEATNRYGCQRGLLGTLKMAGRGQQEICCKDEKAAAFR